VLSFRIGTLLSVRGAAALAVFVASFGGVCFEAGRKGGDGGFCSVLLLVREGNSSVVWHPANKNSRSAQTAKRAALIGFNIKEWTRAGKQAFTFRAPAPAPAPLISIANRDLVWLAQISQTLRSTTVREKRVER
jgi:hypothetical protein